MPFEVWWLWNTAPGGGKFVYLQFVNQSARLYGIDVSGRGKPGPASAGVTP